MRNSWMKFGALGALGASLVLGQPTAGAADFDPDAGGAVSQAGACGKPGQPPCPLQDWMRRNVAATLAANDSAALSIALAKAAALSPDPAWASWTSSASAGAAAAKRGDVVGARAACKSCHEAWREEYRAKFRLRPIPR